MSKRISRRTWLTSVPALGGLLLTGCSRETFVPPRVRGGLIGAADVLTMSTNRLLLSGQQLAREYRRSDVADPFPTWNQTNPRNEEYQRHLSEGFRNWRLPISGLVAASARAVARRDQEPACPHANHRARVRTGLVGDRRVDGRAAPAGARSGGRRHACGALRRHRHLRRVVRGIRSVRGRASSDDPCLRTQRPRPSDEATARRSVSASNDSADTRTSSSCDRFRWSTRWPALAGARVESTRTSGSTGSPAYSGRPRILAGHEMRKRVLVCTVLACVMTATNASAQMITNLIKRVGIGGSVGTFFTSDDNVNTGPGGRRQRRPGAQARARRDGWLGMVPDRSHIVRRLRRRGSWTSSRPSGHGRRWLHLGEGPTRH